MNRDALVAELESRLAATHPAHHQAFLATDGADPDWSIWYADHLKEGGIEALLGRDLSRSELSRTLAELDEEQRANAPDDAWPAFYAQRLADRYVARPEESLALYHFEGCPYCRMVRRVIDELGIEVELRDIHHDRNHLDALVGERGRATVPVLRCTSGDADRWLPESRDIIAYLRERFGSAA